MLTSKWTSSSFSKWSHSSVDKKSRSTFSCNSGSSRYKWDESRRGWIIGGKPWVTVDHRECLQWEARWWYMLGFCCRVNSMLDTGLLCFLTGVLYHKYWVIVYRMSWICPSSGVSPYYMRPLITSGAKNTECHKEEFECHENQLDTIVLYTIPTFSFLSPSIERNT